MARKVKKQNKSRRNLIIIIILIAVVGILALFKAYAANAVSFYVSPTSGTYEKGATINMAVRLNTTVAVSTTQVEAVYPADKLEFVSSSATGIGLANLTVTKLSNGTIKIVNNNGFNLFGKSGDLLLANLSFKVIDGGSAKVSLKSPTATSLVGLVTNLIDSSIINTIGSNLTLTVPGSPQTPVIPVTPTPVVSNPTSPITSQSTITTGQNNKTSTNTKKSVEPEIASALPTTATEQGPDLTLTATDGSQLPYASFKQSGFSNTAGLASHNKLPLVLIGVGALSVYGVLLLVGVIKR